MQVLSLILGWLCLFIRLIAAVPEPSYEILESLKATPDAWVRGSAPSPSTLLNLRLALQQPRAADFEQYVVNISTPGHPNYGRHLKRHEVKDFLQPQKEISRKTLTWLESAGIPKHNIEDDGDWITFTLRVSQAEQMLNTNFYYFHNTAANTTAIRTLHYSIPRYLHDLVHMIQPTTRFGQIRPQISWLKGGRLEDETVFPGSYNASFCNHTITPDCIRGLYGIDGFQGNPTLGNKLGISGYLENYAQYEELASFTGRFAKYAMGTNFSVESVNGEHNLQSIGSDSGEANLDTQYGVSIGFGTPVTYYNDGGRGKLNPDLDQPGQWSNTNEPYLDQLHYLLKLPDADLPTVLTTSYGEDEQSVPEPYANATCALFAQLGARGVSVIFSSGDTGVGSACQTNDGKNTTRFLPIFPASCPFVTSVGGTYRVEPERAVYLSSGGFSDLWARPKYQDKAVETYLGHLGKKWKGLYNPAGRAFPDVAAQAMGFLVYEQGSLMRYDGTSCAAPVFAAIIANLNSIRMSAGFSPLGFLNPWLYGLPITEKGRDAGFTDITLGGSRGCTGYDMYSGLKTPYVPGASWNATAGWDPVTGLGTPWFPGLVRNMFESDTPGDNWNGTAEKKWMVVNGTQYREGRWRRGGVRH